jgi:hypothetical protein
MRSHSTLLWSAALGVVVVVAAGISGTVRFAGPRWVPHLNVTTNKRKVTYVKPPSAKGIPRVPPRHGGTSFPLGQVLLWTVVAVMVIAVATLLWRWWTHHPRRESTSQDFVQGTTVTENLIAGEPELELDTPNLRTGIELALQVLDEQREPADAIVRAWLGLQETAEESGIVRRPDETPTEFTSRILSRAVVDGQAVRTLLSLYLRARFADRPVTSDDVTAARTALQELSRSWPAPDPPATVRAR